MKKTVTIVLTIFILLMCINTVNAEDNSLDNVNLTDSNLNETLNHTHSQASQILDSPIKNSVNAPGGTFSDLQSIISSASSGDTIEITGDYYNSGSESQITANKNLVINGNGHTIDGRGVSRILISKGNYNIEINDWTVINAYTNDGYYWTESGGAIVLMPSTAGTLLVRNSRFYNNLGTEWAGANGAALCVNPSNFNGNSYLYVYNCTFINNTVIDGGDSNGGAIETPGSYSFIYNSTFINNKAYSSSYAGHGGAIASWNLLKMMGELFILDLQEVLLL